MVYEGEGEVSLPDLMETLRNELNHAPPTPLYGTNFQNGTANNLL
jgi:hypothetical protein